MDFNQRSSMLEILDTGPFHERELIESLEFLKLTNGYFGGARVILRHMQAFLRSWPKERPISVLDVGTGLGDIPVALARWAQSAGFELECTGIDLNPEIIKHAQSRAPRFLPVGFRTMDFMRLPKNEPAYDFVISSLLLHHLSPSELPIALRQMDCLARCGLILSDLSRARSSYWAVRAAAMLWGNRVVKNDGPLSVLRAFKVRELTELAQSLQLNYLEANQERFFRLSLSGKKS